MCPFSKHQKETIKSFLLGKDFEDVFEFVEENPPLRIRIVNKNGRNLQRCDDLREYRLNLRVVESFKDGKKTHRIVGFDEYDDGWY